MMHKIVKQPWGVCMKIFLKRKSNEIKSTNSTKLSFVNFSWIHEHFCKMPIRFTVIFFVVMIKMQKVHGYLKYKIVHAFDVEKNVW